jgi:UDP-N-acetylmuramate dehydrogenase
MSWASLHNCETNGAFGRRTTYRVGGTARYVVSVERLDDLAAVAAAYRVEPLPIYVLGKGSNTLVADEGFSGAVLLLGSAFGDIDVHDASGHVVVTAGAALALPILARRLVSEYGVAGFEWAVGVPGSVGGAVAMNAGGHGSDMAASVIEVQVYDLEQDAVGWRSPEALAFGYRSSSIRATEVVLAARLQLQRAVDDTPSEALAEIVKWRRAHQPGGANAGSVFTNPTGDAAGRLIESAGLKGRRLGTASVSEKHANFIQADENGSANDVAELVSVVRAEVARTSGVTLKTEIRMVGFPQ